MQEGRLFIGRISVSFQALRPQYPMRRGRTSCPVVRSARFGVTHFSVTRKCVMFKDLNSTVGFMRGEYARSPGQESRRQSGH